MRSVDRDKQLLGSSMHQPVPTVSRADVERIVWRDFAPADVSRALAILDEYQSDGGTPSRVQVAVLKLAAGDISALRRQIETAKFDYRDVLASAEYPRYSREIGFDDVSESVKRVVIDDDWKQYESWLKR
jgi:hypothetical protein